MYECLGSFHLRIGAKPEVANYNSVGGKNSETLDASAALYPLREDVFVRDCC